MIEAYPLCWPVGYPRIKEPLQSTYRLTPNESLKSLLLEIKRLCQDENPIISSNVPLRKSDGKMYLEIAKDELHDSGVAVYFMMDGIQKVLACDKWLTPAENIRALALTIDALRALPRHGASQILERVFTGLGALPAPGDLTTINSFWEVLGLSARPVDKEIVEAAYKRQVMKVHPDRPGGSTIAFQQLQEAYQKALKTYQ